MLCVRYVSEIMATNAMYYPHIHFRSRRWLRSALLYYDHITRIVPEGINPDTVDEYAHFSDDAKQLASEVTELTAAGFIRNQHPDKESVAKTADDFLNFVSKNLIDPARRSAVLPALKRHSPHMSLHPAKIDPGLANILFDLGLARVNEADVYHDWHVDAGTAVLYLLYLSNQMAKGRPLVTDNLRYETLLYRDVDAPTATGKNDKPRDRSFLLVSATFDSVLPANLEDIPLQNLLRFRDQHGAARGRLQKQIGLLANAVSEAKDEEELHSAIATQSAIIKEEKSILEAKLRGNNLAVATGLFGVSVPSYVLHLATSHPMLIALAAGVAISSTLYKFALDRKVTRGSSPYQYVLDVENLVSKEHVAQDKFVRLNLGDDDYDDRIVGIKGKKIG